MYTQVSKEALDFVNNHIDELISDKNLGEQMERLICLRYGVGSERPLGFKELRKIFKWPPAKMKREILKAERLVFNALKKRV